MKKLAMTLCFFLVFIMSSVSNAATITVTLPEYTGSIYHPPGYYNDPFYVGSFNYNLLGETILSATISGQWGNSSVGTTAHNRLYADQVLVADTYLASPDPYWNIVQWSYTFLDFATLLDGRVDFGGVQLSEYYIQLGKTTLTIVTNGPERVPEPATMLLLGFGILGLAGARKFKK